jgi:hypothetical protein
MKDAAPLCEPAPNTFCDDFERPTVQGDWTLATETSGGTLEIVQGTTGRRLQATCPSPGAVAQLVRAFSEIPTRVHLELTLEFAALPSNGDVYITGIRMDSVESSSVVYLYAGNSGVALVQQVAGVSSAQGHYKAYPLHVPPGTPHRLAIDLTFGGKIQVTIDGVVAIDRAAETFLIPAAPRLTAGATSLDGQGAGFTSLIDDYVFTAE